MKVKINDKEIELRYSMRMFINYEAIMGKSLDAADLQNYTNFIALFYSCIIASAHYNKIQPDFDYSDFINWLDDNGGEVLLVEFGQWYMKTAEATVRLIGNISKPAEEGRKKTGKKS